MHIVIAGASGFLGTALRRHWSEAGHRITQLVRGEQHGDDQMRWDPDQGQLDVSLVQVSRRHGQSRRSPDRALA
ncbi:MAG: NAD-dependent epimerase/dehydratase family protein, partial [Nocardioidaceae bacterium]